MKTQYEIENMKNEIQEKIVKYGEQANYFYQQGNENMFNHFDREWAKAVAQYNILIDVLK